MTSHKLLDVLDLNAVEHLAAACREAGSDLPAEELKALQVGKIGEEGGEAMHQLHGLKGLTTCDCPEHSWDGVMNDLGGAVLASLIAMVYIDPDGWRTTLAEVLHRRTRRGREHAAATA
ncbi:hypothetical protein [Streptomyces sp. NPDC045470]|uniref:hypothetical protein n=1 Tax=Streptomyces sp. NPDC045470 TaxID=3155469 RepID=UPI0033D04C43